MRIAVLLALLALAGCGSSAQEKPAAPRQTAAAPAATATTTQAAASQDEQAIRDTLDGYVAAVRAGDAKKVCARYMARELVKRIEALGSDCESFTADRVKEGGPQFRLEVSSVQVTGDRALVRARSYESDGARPGDTPMVREGGRWLMTIPSQP
jgi:ketosteroid isomerase-like protein